MTLDSWVLVPVVDLAVFARLDPDPPWAMISENLTPCMDTQQHQGIWMGFLNMSNDFQTFQISYK